MRRLLLLVAMFTSLLAPPGLIAWGAASANTDSNDVRVMVSSTAPEAAPALDSSELSWSSRLNDVADQHRRIIRSNCS